MTETINLLLVDDHVLFRKGVAALLSTEAGLAIIGEADDGCAAIKIAQEMMPDVILMDVHMPNCDGLTAVRAIKKELPTTKIIMLTMDEDDETLFEAIKSGAQGFLLKKLKPEQLIETIQKVSRGEVALSPALLSKILAEFQEPTIKSKSPKSMQEQLTRREMDVLQEIVKGATNREIAETLNITENTVKKHLQGILSRLHLQNRIQAAVYAVQEGLLNNQKKETGG